MQQSTELFAFHCYCPWFVFHAGPPPTPLIHFSQYQTVNALKKAGCSENPGYILLCSYLVTVNVGLHAASQCCLISDLILEARFAYFNCVKYWHVTQNHEPHFSSKFSKKFNRNLTQFPSTTVRVGCVEINVWWDSFSSRVLINHRRRRGHDEMA